MLVSRGQNVFDAQGVLHDETVRGQLQQFMQGFADFIAREQTPQPHKPEAAGRGAGWLLHRASGKLCTAPMPIHIWLRAVAPQLPECDAHPRATTPSGVG